MRTTILLIIVLSMPHAVADSVETLKEIETVGVQRIVAGQDAQSQIDNLNDTSRKLVDDYQAQLKLVEGLETYISLLDKQLNGQTEEIATLQKSIIDVAVIERQILPLMLRMIETLERFVALDVPFLLDERRDRVADLKTLMGRSDVTVAEKARRVFEAYQIENEYGRTIESYTAKLDLPDASYDAEFLRIGRLSLMYSAVGAERFGFWDKATDQWQDLDKSPWSRLIGDGLKVARQEVAPQLIHFPLDPALGIGQ